MIDIVPATDLDTVLVPVRDTVRGRGRDIVRDIEPGTAQVPGPDTVPAPERGIALGPDTVRGTVNDLRTVRVRNTVRVPRDTARPMRREAYLGIAAGLCGVKIRVVETIGSP